MHLHRFDSQDEDYGGTKVLSAVLLHFFVRLYTIFVHAFCTLQINGGNVYNSPFNLRGDPAAAAYGAKSLAESTMPPSTVGNTKH